MTGTVDGGRAHYTPRCQFVQCLIYLRGVPTTSVSAYTPGVRGRHKKVSTVDHRTASYSVKIYDRMSDGNTEPKVVTYSPKSNIFQAILHIPLPLGVAIK